MTEIYEIAIVGSGPAGASAAARAAQLGRSHVLLERTDHLSDTIYKYQRGKYVMATPDNLPLQSDLKFVADSRENILGWWDDAMAGKTEETSGKPVNVRFNSEVVGIEGEKGDFTLKLGDGAEVKAANVVLAIGLQGNLRTLPSDVPGWDNGLTEYQLDDPKDYWDKDVVVIGAGDAAIENAVALSENDNRVTIVNRKREFARAKSGNISLILSSIKDEKLECAYNASPARVEENAIILKTPEGERIVKADRVIARLGAIAPKKFVEACGGVFEEGADYPKVDEVYQSNREGVYIIGALAGYPLIKHCMNQGYEVIHTIVGDPVDGPDLKLLEDKFRVLPGYRSVLETLQEVKDTVPLFQQLTLLQLREFLLDADIETPGAGDVIMRKTDAGDSLFVIKQGEVDVDVGEGTVVHLGPGDFFGEMGLIMGRRRSIDVTASNTGGAVVLMEIPRTAALKLLAASPVAKQVMDETAIFRQLQVFLSPDLVREDVQELMDAAVTKEFNRGEAMIEEGDAGDVLYLLRSGSVSVTKNVGGRDVVLAYLPAGKFVGEMALLFHQVRSATVRATVATEAVEIDGALFRSLLDAKPRLKAIVDEVARERAQGLSRTADTEATKKVDFLLQNGLGEATNAIVIDESICVRCDYCEKACAETHDGISRLDRESGPTYAELHIPISCRHCEQPHCMTDCPPNALYRSPTGEVAVNDTCIGCGNCVRNCPYDAIKLSAKPKKRGGLLGWLLFGGRYGPGEREKPKKSLENKEMARKCDLCSGIKGGPACVRACPTGAVIRISPEDLFKRIKEEV